MTDRMNFGCGSIQPDGWVNVDEHDHGQAIVASGLALPFANATIGLIVANHSLQQVNVHDVPAVMAEFHRVLRPCGVLRIMVPDIRAAFLAYENGRLDWFPNGEDTIDERFTAYLTWYGTNTTPFTAATLRKAVVTAGFAPYFAAAFGHSFSTDLLATALDDRAGESLYLDAVKP